MRLLKHYIACAALGVSLGWATPSGAEGVAVGDATAEQRRAAQEKFAEARRAFDTRRFVDAIAGFRASFDIVASPNTHLMIAHAMRELGRHAEAYEELGAVLEEAKALAGDDERYASTAELAEEERAALREKIALVTVTIADPEPGATLTIGGRAIAPDGWSKPIPADPGAITIVYEGSQGPVVRKLELEAGGTATVELAAPTPEPAPPTTPPPPDDGGERGWQWTGTQRYVAYGLAGLGVVSFVVAGVTGGLAQGKHAELVDACGDLPCPDRQSDIDAGRSLMTTSNVTLITGAVLVGAGVALWFTAPDEEEPGAATSRLRVGPGAVSWEGTF